MPGDGHFDERVAAGYDEDVAAMFDPAVVAPVVDRLAALAGSGWALEFAIGTGRIALPLARRGVPVHGIELSRAMAARLAAKPGAETIGVTIGDMASARAPGRYALVYLVFDTITNLASQAAQVAAFRNAAKHLEPGGAFLVEAEVPRLQKLPFGETLIPFRLPDGRIGVDELDVVTQAMRSHHFTGPDGAPSPRSLSLRYVFPSELDLMAEMAGLVLETRDGGFRGEAFTRFSERHVSVWRRPAAGQQVSR